MTNIANNDPLSSLVVDTEELDRKKLTELLDEYCTISKEGHIRSTANFSLLDARSKVLAVILAQKAAKALNLSDTDQILPKQIESISGLPGGTVRVKLMELRQKRLVDSVKGNYSVPNHAILHITLNSKELPRKSIERARVKVRSTRRIQTEELTKLIEIDQEKIGEKRLAFLLSPGKYLERSLVVLSIAREIGIEALTPADVTGFLKEKIRIAVRRENISLALGRGMPKYVDRSRDPKTGGYRYRIMAAGDKTLEELGILTQAKK